MKFCLDHWGRLRSEIDQRGLSVLVPDSGQQAGERFVKAAEGNDSIASFDPLMYAHMAIMTHALDAVGLAAMVDNDDGSARCPLCFLNALHERTCTGCLRPQVNGFDDWLVKAVDAAEGHLDALKAGLAP